MGAFGWSLPPGCGTLPGEEDCPCEVCNGNPDTVDTKKFGACVCPECKVCGEYGNPQCYELAPGGCGLQKSPEQIAQFVYFNTLWIEQGRREAEAEESFLRQEQECY